VLRLNHGLFGHRYLMDCIVPGGVACDLDRSGLAAIGRECDALEREVHVLRDIYDEHSGLQDRFLTCGRLTPGTAVKLGVIGLAGRASSQPGTCAQAQCGDLLDARENPQGRDVVARVICASTKFLKRLRLVRAVLGHRHGAIAAPLPALAADTAGLGWVEGWPGESLIALEAGADGRIRSCHAHDPSWQNWPALAFAVFNNIVPDFPLINKSFNLSYSACDL
jgi:Ni,Fe-hydrogenase III large subunit